jgi:VIT1/CCC1 family predicted Fe2+/Mn2+ transporter
MVGMTGSEPTVHPNEPHTPGVSSRLNWLRAGVLGANDGIVSTAALVVGVAGATTDTTAILVAGVAGLVGGAVSMALGEYVSVSSQRDSERALVAKEVGELAEFPEAEFAELESLLRDRGLSEETSRQAALEMTEHDALATHLEFELGIKEEELANPWHAAFSSAVAFTAGAILPLISILLPPADLRVPVTFVVVLLTLALTGAISADIGGSSKRQAATRLVIGGALALAATFLIGTLLGTTVA